MILVRLNKRQEISFDFIPKTRVVKDFAVNPIGYSIAGPADRPAAGLRSVPEGGVFFTLCRGNLLWGEELIVAYWYFNSRFSILLFR
jgi:hypothetical protein